MDVEAAISIGADVEGLCESELIAAVHHEVSVDGDEDTAWDGALLDVRIHVRKLNLFESE